MCKKTVEASLFQKECFKTSTDGIVVKLDLDADDIQAAAVLAQNSNVIVLKMCLENNWQPCFAKAKVHVKLKYNKVEFYEANQNLIAEFDRLYGDTNYTAIHWEQWLPTVARKPNCPFHSSFTDMFTERLKDFLLNGTAKLRGIYMKALCELIKSMSLDKALLLADRAAEKCFESIDEILSLAI